MTLGPMLTTASPAEGLVAVKACDDPEFDIELHVSKGTGRAYRPSPCA
jgi:hypothetical protein